MQHQRGDEVTSCLCSLLLWCWLWCGIGLEVQEQHQQMQPGGKKLFLLSLVGVLHQKKPFPRAAGQPGHCVRRPVLELLLLSDVLSAGARDALTCSAPGAPSQPVPETAIQDMVEVRAGLLQGASPGAGFGFNRADPRRSNLGSHIALLPFACGDQCRLSLAETLGLRHGDAGGVVGHPACPTCLHRDWLFLCLCQSPHQPLQRDYIPSVEPCPLITTCNQTPKHRFIHFLTASSKAPQQLCPPHWAVRWNCSYPELEVRKGL